MLPPALVYPSSSPLILDDSMRKTAFQRTADILQECDKIRLNLNLPPEALGRILDVYISSAREVAIEKEQADLAARMQRVPMTIGSHDDRHQPFRILPHQVVQVIECPQWPSYRVEEIEINGDPTRWLVHEIKIGNVPQSPRLLLPPIPGERFRKGGIMSDLRLDVCQIAMHFVMAVEYVGPEAEGEVFEATLVGTAMK
jgi:hypothetical protein